MQCKKQVWMNVAYLIASLSKDKSTHIGAVIIGPDDEVRSTGWNSFPRDINDDVQERQERPEKYFWMAHAERNSIYNAARMGLSVKGCTMYTNGIPCTDCAIAIIQSGISKVVVDAYWDKQNADKWEISGGKTLEMFKEAGIEIEFLNVDILTIERFKRGRTF